MFYVPANTVQVIWETVFTGQKTQPTVSNYWRKIYKRQSKQRKQLNHTDRHTIIDTKKDIHKKHSKSPIVYTNMGWLGESSQRAGSLSLTAVGLPPRYPLGLHIGPWWKVYDDLTHISQWYLWWPLYFSRTKSYRAWSRAQHSRARFLYKPLCFVM